jgi:hypothetical protein
MNPLLAPYNPVSPDLPGFGGVPVLFSQWFPELVLRQQKQLGVLPVPLPGCKHLSVDNRLARPVWLDLAYKPGTTTISYIVDDQSRWQLNSHIPFGQVTIYDLWLSGENNPTGRLWGERGGQRNEDNLPYSIFQPAGAVQRRAGGLLLSGASEPLAVDSAQRAIKPVANYPQEALATGSGAVTISAEKTALSLAAQANAAGIHPFVGGVGYINLVAWSNPSGAAFTIQVIPVGANGNPGLGGTFTVDAGMAQTMTVEAETLICNFTAAGQHVWTWQAVAFNVAGEP